MPPSPERCGAVVVCFNPPPGLSARLATLATQVDRLVVVDNGPPEQHADLAASLGALPHLRIIANPHNAGIATALNQGLRALAAEGIRWALTLDHDSTPTPAMLPRLLEATTSSHATDAALFVPRIHYALPEMVCRWPVTRPGDRYAFRRVAYDRMRTPTPVDLAISSGMLIDLAQLDHIGGFLEGLFIDLVDTEYCLRARSLGFSVMAVPDAILEHHLGEVECRRLGSVKAYPTFHSPLRHYYISRNRVHLYRKYGRKFPSWAIYESLSGLKLIAKVTLFEDRRLEKLAATLRGTIDGLKGLTGRYMPP